MVWWLTLPPVAPAARVQYPVKTGIIYLVLKSGSQHWEVCIPFESENRINVSRVSIWDGKEPPRMESTVAVTTLSASIEISV